MDAIYKNLMYSRTTAAFGRGRHKLEILSDSGRVKSVLEELSAKGSEESVLWGIFDQNTLSRMLLRLVGWPTAPRNGILVRCLWREESQEYWIYSCQINRGIANNRVYFTIFNLSGNLVEVGRMQNNFRTSHIQGSLEFNEAECFFPSNSPKRCRESIIFAEKLLLNLELNRIQIPSKETKYSRVGF